eukprot:XP_003731346.1 PREDICTED: deleted in malignant brain tumors 1 protein-like [Strongylocentrotus purpuratus]
MTVCDDIWNLFNARVTCRMLGFVGALDAPRSAMFGQGSGDTIGVNCLGTEDSLQDCVDVAVESYCGHHKDASAVCYSGVRLVGGPYDAEGRVQVLYDGSWGTICDDTWDLRDARVVCRMLGFDGALDAPGSARFGQGSGDILLDDPFQVRLASGSNDVEGRVVVMYEGSWGTICDVGWDLRDARVVCRMLGFGGALDAPISARFGQGSGRILLANVGCEGTEANLADCAHRGIGDYCDHRRDAGAICYSGDPFQVRLVNGSNDAEGRVEVRHDVSWGTVCDDLWDLRDARVVCRMLGFDGALDAPGSARFGQGSGDILLDDVGCSDPFQVRLVNGSNDAEGRVEVRHDVSWGTVCDDLWDLRDARVVCRMLGFDGALDAPGSARFGQGSGDILLDDPFQVRLASGSNDVEGRVVVMYEGSWGTICDVGWDLRDARVVCRMLGFGGALDAPISARFGQGSGRILLANVGCEGTEANLADCAHRGIGDYCDHRRDAGAICYSGVHPKPFQVRFVGGSNDSQGRVEVLHDGSWGTICDDSWDLRDASVVCIMLGFDGALDAPTSARFGQGSGHVLLTYVSCDGTEGNLADCAHAGIDRYPCSHLRDAGAVCYSGAIEVDRTKLNSANKQES